MKITLSNMMGILPETQEITVIGDGNYHISGSADTINTWLSTEILEYKVVNIEAEKDVIKIWVED